MLAVRSDGISFLECAEVAIKEPQLLAQVDRLCGTNLLRNGHPLELAIDEACGKTEDDIRVFLNFVWECVFTRLPLLESPEPKRATG